MARTDGSSGKKAGLRGINDNPEVDVESISTAGNSQQKPPKIKLPSKVPTPSVDHAALNWHQFNDPIVLDAPPATMTLADRSSTFAPGLASIYTGLQKIALSSSDLSFHSQFFRFLSSTASR